MERDVTWSDNFQDVDSVALLDLILDYLGFEVDSVDDVARGAFLNHI